MRSVRTMPKQQLCFHALFCRFSSHFDLLLPPLPCAFPGFSAKMTANQSPQYAISADPASSFILGTLRACEHRLEEAAARFGCRSWRLPHNMTSCAKCVPCCNAHTRTTRGCTMCSTQEDQAMALILSDLPLRARDTDLPASNMLTC